MSDAMDRLNQLAGLWLARLKSEQNDCRFERRAIDDEALASIKARAELGAELSAAILSPDVPLGVQAHGRVWYTEGDCYPMAFSADYPDDDNLITLYRSATERARRRVA